MPSRYTTTYTTARGADQRKPAGCSRSACRGSMNCCATVSCSPTQTAITAASRWRRFMVYVDRRLADSGGSWRQITPQPRSKRRGRACARQLESTTTE